MLRLEPSGLEPPRESAAERAARIAALRKIIRAGKYHVSAHDLADCLLECLDWQ
jgi:anti-sigma28 factor (negative regulator of flagellin synthesis)